METELKFQVPPDRRAALLKAVATATAVRTRLQAVYADTPGQALAHAGLALRLRKEGRLWVQTLKGRGDGLLQRLEHEVPLPAQRGVPALDPQRHACSAAGQALLAVLGKAAPDALQPVYRTDIQRLHRRLRHAGATIELAYDRGFIVAGTQRLVVDEIEFELISGPAPALAELAARWAARHGLWWDVRTKSERGCRLALGLHQVPPTTSSPPCWPAHATPAQAWQACLLAALAQALPNAAELAAGTATPEHLHQLRVGLRRLRSALRVFAPWSGDEAAALALEAAWQEPFAALGATRDADVLAQVWPSLLQAAGAPAFDWPAAESAQDVAATVRGAPFNQLALHTLALALAGGPDAPALGHSDLRRMLRPLWRQIRRDAPGFAQASVAQQHQLRKRIKRLRYALEFVAPVLDVKATRRLHRGLCRALDALGHSHDLQLAEAIFRQWAEQQPAASFAAGYAAGLQAAARRRAIKALDALAELRLP